MTSKGRVIMADSGSSVGSVVAAFALGALAGAAVALLYAPASGEETRRRMARRARQGRDQLASVVERGREAFETVRSMGPSGEDAS
jgi:gas vesicle protein